MRGLSLRELFSATTREVVVAEVERRKTTLSFPSDSKRDNWPGGRIFSFIS